MPTNTMYSMPGWARLSLLLGALVGGASACQPAAREQPAQQAGPWRLVQRPTDQAVAYVSATGDTVIPFGRYPQAFTPRFGEVAVVLKPGVGFVGIDRREQVRFRVYPFDNGPDYPAEGLFRILGDSGRIGYADTLGRVVIRPQFEAAESFQGGRARVGRRCRSVADGEHTGMECAQWFTVDRNGQLTPAR